jgi:hypothetical protein
VQQSCGELSSIFYIYFYLVFDCPDRCGELTPAKPPRNQSRHVKLPGGREAKNQKQVRHHEATCKPGAAGRTAKAEAILEKVRRARAVLDKIASE